MPGCPPRWCALVTGLQPLSTAILSRPLLGDRVDRRQWFGIMLGFVGAVLVLAPKVSLAGSHIPTLPLAAAGLAMLAITLGTIWQKRVSVGADVRAGAAIQFAAAAIVTTPIALATGHGNFDGSWQVWLGLGWAVIGLSIGAISLLLLMIARSAVTVVASLFYLVPPVVALLAFLFFGETLSAIQIVGMIIAAIGVAIATRR